MQRVTNGRPIVPAASGPLIEPAGQFKPQISRDPDIYRRLNRDLGRSIIGGTAKKLRD